MSENVESQSAAPEQDVLLDVRHLTKRFAAETNFFGRATSYVQAVDDVSFQIRRGEAFGLVGESGCGKTTVGKMLVNLLAPTSGTIIFDGHDLTAMKRSERKRYCKDIQLIFQDPYASLNPRMRIGDIIAEPIITNNILPKDQVESRVDELLECVGLANYMRNRYPHEFSGGQRQRVGIARALAVNPKLIVCDEPVSALDVSIQAQVLNLLDDLKERFGLTYLFIAHGLNVVKHVSDRVGVMYLGKMMEIAPKKSLYADPLSPYTQALLSAIPSVDPAAKRERIILEGDVPSPIDPPAGCRFAGRCFAKVEGCDEVMPPLSEVKPDHCVASRRLARGRESARTVALRFDSRPRLRGGAAFLVGNARSRRLVREKPSKMATYRRSGTISGETPPFSHGWQNSTWAFANVHASGSRNPCQNAVSWPKNGRGNASATGVCG